MKTSAQETLITLANINQLVANVVRNIVGNELSTAINGEKATNNMLYKLTQSEIKKELSVHLGVN